MNYNVKVVIINFVFLGLFWIVGGQSNVNAVSASAIERRGSVAVNELQLLDADGNVRAGLKFDVNGNPAIFFTDKQGKLKALLGVAKGDALLSFRDNNGRPRLGLSISKNQSPGIVLNYMNGNNAIVMGPNTNSGNSVALYAADGKPGMLLAISKNQPRIGMFDKNERLRVMFGMNPGNSSVLAFLDENAYPALAMGHLLGTPMFRLQRPDKTGIFASYAPDNNVILSMQKEGRFTWSVPEIPRGGRAGDDPLNGIDWDKMIKGWSK